MYKKILPAIALCLVLCLASFALGRMTAKPDFQANPSSTDSTPAEKKLTPDDSEPTPPNTTPTTPAPNKNTTSPLSASEKTALENTLIAEQYKDLPPDILGEAPSYQYNIYHFPKSNSTFVCFTNDQLIYQYRDQELIQSWSDFFFQYGDQLVDISTEQDPEPIICISNTSEHHARHQLIELRADGTFSLFCNLTWVEIDDTTSYDLHGLTIEDNTLYYLTRKDSHIETTKLLDGVVSAGYGGPYMVVAMTDGISYMKIRSSFLGEFDDDENLYLYLGESEYWTPERIASAWKSYISPGFTNYPTTGEFTWFIKSDTAKLVTLS